jgi:glycosyltransferase involved in cell wall biosynthesis
MILSILTPTIRGREEQLQALQDRIEEQIQQHCPGEAEHLVLCDNRARSIGAKRQALLDIARGTYFAFVDDDDDIADDYVQEILKVARLNTADVITFCQFATYNGAVSQVEFKLGQGDHPFASGGVTLRDAWHVCAWRRDRVADCQFGESNYGEDSIWCQQARQRVSTTIHIPSTLHFYRHDAATTAAPEPS